MTVDPTSGPTCTTTWTAGADTCQHLGGFCEKVAGGDPLSSLMMIVAEDDTLGGKIDRVLQDVQKKRTLDAHQKRLELMQKYWNAIGKAKRWGFLGKLFSGLLGALSAGLAVATGGGLAPALAGAAAGVAKATGSIGSAAYKVRAGNAKAGQMVAEHQQRQAAEARERIIQYMATAAEQEMAMLGVLGRMASNSNGIRFGR